MLEISHEAFLALFALFAQPAVYNFVPAQTAVEYSVDTTLHTVHGTLALKRDTLRINPASGRTEGELVVDASSRAFGSEGRDHKMTHEILETDKYPEIVFQPDRGCAGRGRRIRGDRALRGSLLPVNKVVTVTVHTVVRPAI